MSWVFGIVGPDQQLVQTWSRDLQERVPAPLFSSSSVFHHWIAGGRPDTCTFQNAAGHDRLVLGWPQPEGTPPSRHFISIRQDAQGVTCETDRLGLRTLYFATHLGHLVFSSRLDWLARTTGNAELAPGAFGSHWLLFNQIGTGSLVQGIDRLGPAGRLVIRPDGRYDVHHSPWLPAPQQPEHDVASILTAQANPTLPQGFVLSLGLSGGLDSRLLLALQDSNTHTRVHSYGAPDNPDVRIAKQLATAAGVLHAVRPDQVPDMDTCLRLLQHHAGCTNALVPASAVVRFHQSAALHEEPTLLIDGGFGEIGRCQYMNRLRLRLSKTATREDLIPLLPAFRLPRPALFSTALLHHLERAVLATWQEAVGALPAGPLWTRDNLLDLMSVRYRLPNFFGYEQNRLDQDVLNYMPFAQEAFLNRVFHTPVEKRRNGKQYKRLIRDRAPLLTQYPLVKGAHTYPFRLGPRGAFLWTQIARKLRPNTATNATREAFLRRLKPYVLDRIHATGFQSIPYYNHALIREQVASYYDTGKEAHAVDWWLMMDTWLQGLGSR